MKFIFPAPQFPSLAVAGDDGRFPVHRIYCIGRNYPDHVREMDGDRRRPPFFFQKPVDALLPGGGEFPYPPASDDVHHEVELVVAMGGGGVDIAVGEALGHVYGYGVGLDMTRRDLQSLAKREGKPWDAAKGFDFSAPVSSLRPAAEIGHPADGRIWLAVNGDIRQEGSLDRQIWNVGEGIAHLSRLFEIRPGDLIFTGTPAGVGPVRPGDAVTAGIDGIAELQITVVGK